MSATGYDKLSIPASAVIGSATQTGDGLDDLTAAGAFVGRDNITVRVAIDAVGTPDTFSVSIDGGESTESTGTAIDGAAQTLFEGVTGTFAATTGHTLADYWDIICTASWYYRCLGLESNLPNHFPTGWTAANFNSRTRPKAYDDAKDKILDMPWVIDRNPDYLDQIWDSDQLDDGELYLCMARIYKQKATSKDDFYYQKWQMYEDLARLFFKRLQIRLDESVEISLEDTVVTSRVFHTRLRRV